MFNIRHSYFNIFSSGTSSVSLQNLEHLKRILFHYLPLFQTNPGERRIPAGFSGGTLAHILDWLIDLTFLQQVQKYFKTNITVLWFFLYNDCFSSILLLKVKFSSFIKYQVLYRHIYRKKIRPWLHWELGNCVEWMSSMFFIFPTKCLWIL